MRVCKAQKASSAESGEVLPCDGWTLLTPRRIELAQHYLEIMREMNRATYSPKRPLREMQAMTQPPCEYYYFAGSGFELVLGFRWLERIGRYRIMSTGFVGAIDPREALDRIAAKAREFARRKQVDRLVAVQPSHMDSPQILAFYRLLDQHPTLQVRRGHAVAQGEYLWIRFRR